MKPIDLAVLCTPIASVPSVIMECSAAGVDSAIIYSAGGKEIGEQGAAIEEEIRAAAASPAISPVSAPTSVAPTSALRPARVLPPKCRVIHIVVSSSANPPPSSVTGSTLLSSRLDQSSSSAP